MPPQEPIYADSSSELFMSSSANSSSSESLTLLGENALKRAADNLYTREELLSYAKCFTTSKSTRTKSNSRWKGLFYSLTKLPSALIRYGLLFPLRSLILSASTMAFFMTLPIGVTLKSKRIVSLCVKLYCKGFLLSLGARVKYIGKKPKLHEPHVFVANHTSYVDYIVLSAHQYPHGVVMAKHGGALGFLQNNGLNYLNSMTFDRANMTERKDLSNSLKKHVHKPETWSNPMLIFPEGTCVNNEYAVRFQKGAFELGVKVCPVGIKYSKSFGDPYWDTRKGFMYYAYYLMTRWWTPIHVYYCDPMTPKCNEKAADYGDRVKRRIADTVGLTCVNFNGMAKRQLLKVLAEEEKRKTR
ncbi:hypothetical protein BDF20DRAFT_913890 [Mycotypha africana]|uniref:uncharacterized protein n=1 Tax=Mycotypha africana TaxID=64632 RepID=UPI002300A5D2|nr:uncharacterized protein BDF20DRAFT_913890 [Mycotypha africana]KAI8977574.1 hypothetical protein BDF20DRAFT_913890 [Mycotypha africana]